MNHIKNCPDRQGSFLCAYILPLSTAKSRPLWPRDGFDIMNMR